MAALAGLAATFASSEQAAALLLGIIFSAFCIAVVIKMGLGNGRRGLLSPPVWVVGYLGLGVGIKGVANLLTETSRTEGLMAVGTPEYAALSIRIFALAACGVVAFLVGDLLARRRGQPDGWLPSSWTAVSIGRALTVSHLCLALGAGVLVARLGMAILLDPSFVAVRGTFGLFWLYPLMYSALFGWAMVISRYWAQGARAPRWAVVGMVVTSVVVYGLTSSKAALVNAVLLLGVASHHLRRPMRLSALFAAGAVFIVALPMLYLHREYGLTPELLAHIDPRALTAGLEILLGRSYLADSFGAVLLQTPRVYPFQYGGPWLELLYFWIPRAWWPAKPVTASLTFAQTYLSSHPETVESFVSPTILGDAYLNFGGLGIVAVMLLLGYLLRRWYMRLEGRRWGPAGAVVYGASFYWLAIGAEQSLAVCTELFVSYTAMAVVVALAAVRRRGVSADRADGGPAPAAPGGAPPAGIG